MNCINCGYRGHPEDRYVLPLEEHLPEFDKLARSKIWVSKIKKYFRIQGTQLEYFICIDCFLEGVNANQLICKGCKKQCAYLVWEDEKYVLRDAGNINRRSMLCLECLDKTYMCPSCRVRRLEYDRYQDMCHQCQPKRYYVNGHAYKPIHFFKYYLPHEDALKTRLFGLEFEFPTGQEFNRDTLASLMGSRLSHKYGIGETQVYYKHDGTINPGFEAVLMPMSREYLFNSPVLSIMNEIQDMVKDVNHKIAEHPKCGLHIHLGRTKRLVTNTDCFKMASWCVANSAFLREIGRRKFNNKCLPILGFGLAGQVTRKAANKDNRYRIVNLEHPNTIEFRFFKMTTSKHLIKASVQFVDMLSQYVKTIPLGNCKLGGFIRYVRKYKKTNQELYLELTRFADESRVMEYEETRSANTLGEFQAAFLPRNEVARLKRAFDNGRF
jgi:hypothetical protein